jgi:polysaccharide biosynthesis transport protein
MELRNYINTLLKWWWLIAACVAIALVTSYLATRSMPRTYASRTTVMVGQALQNPNPSQSEFYTGQILAQSYADLAKRQPVLSGALKALNLDWDWATLKSMVSSQVVAGTQLFDIIVVDIVPARAKALADEVARQLILQSPAGVDENKERERQFILAQIDSLKANIKKSQDDLSQLNDVIANASSASQIQDARTRAANLQSQIGAWQSTYAQLLAQLQIGTPNYLKVVEPAQVPFAPISPNPTQNLMLAAVLALVLACGAAFLLEYIDDTIKSPDDVRQVLSLPLLGSIARFPARDYGSRLITARHPRSPVTEAYRLVRTNLQFSAINGPLSAIEVTSASPLDGKSVTAANIAVILAQSGKRVILVDADLRRPMQHRIFELSNSVGLTSILLDRELPLDDALQAVPVSKLRVLTSGPLPPDPSELLGSMRMEEILTALKQAADVVVLDSPPIMAVADATILATHVDGVLMVVRAGRTRRALIVQSKESLLGVGARVVGVVLNHVSKRGLSYYHYYSSPADQPAKPGRKPLFLKPVSKNGSSVHSAAAPVVAVAASDTPSVAGTTGDAAQGDTSADNEV